MVDTNLIYFLRVRHSIIKFVCYTLKLKKFIKLKQYNPKNKQDFYYYNHIVFIN